MMGFVEEFDPSRLQRQVSPEPAYRSSIRETT